MSTTSKTAMDMGDGVTTFPAVAAAADKPSPWAPLSSYIPFTSGFGAPAPAAAAHQQQVRGIESKLDESINKDLGKAIVQYGLGGLGVGIGAAGLYHLLGAVNKAKPKYKKVGPGAQTVDEEEKIAADPAAPTPYSLDALVSQIGKLVPKGYFQLPDLTKAPVKDYDPGRQGWTTAALLGTTGLGLYGGASLMNSIAEKKKKEDMQEEVADAKAQYQRALFGKSSEALDAAFAQFEKVSEPQQGSTLVDVINTPFRYMAQAGLWGPYLTAVLGSGALASKLTYDWTRARGRDKALQAAQKSRARLNGVAPVYIDPEQMASLKSLAN
jgi:hypothetical protein